MTKTIIRGGIIVTSQAVTWCGYPDGQWSDYRYST